MTNAELIKALRYCKINEPCERCPLVADDDGNGKCVNEMHDAAADALEAAEKRIAELSLDCELFQQKCMELGAQKPKEGEWIIYGMNEYELSYGCVGYEPIYRCSKCGITTESYLRTERPIMPEDADFPNYCPNCGARMTKGEHNNGNAV